MFCLGQYQQHIFMSMAHFLLEIKGFSKTYFMASECFLTLFQTTLCFQMSVVQVFGKHWEKERLLVFSTLFGELSVILIKLGIVIFKIV